MEVPCVPEAAPLAMPQHPREIIGHPAALWMAQAEGPDLWAPAGLPWRLLKSQLLNRCPVSAPAPGTPACFVSRQRGRKDTPHCVISREGEGMGVRLDVSLAHLGAPSREVGEKAQLPRHPKGPPPCTIVLLWGGGREGRVGPRNTTAYGVARCSMKEGTEMKRRDFAESVY